MLLGGSVRRGDQVGAVAIGTERNEISRKAVRALYAMTNAGHFAATSVLATFFLSMMLQKWSETIPT
jgi:hypothetical protein